VDIALEKEKLRQKEREREREKERDKKEQLEREKLEREKKEKQERQERQERDKREADKKRAEEQKRQDELKKKERKEAEVVAKLREENLKRMTGQAGVEGATGAAGATGTALQASGPSPSYAGLIRARIKPNIVFSEEIAGNPVAEVEVRAAPDGTIVGRKLIKSSGVTNWDEAVLKAIDKTEVLPRDTDGRVPSPLVISFRRKD
jgi:colicin import membrane protein